jgi:glycerol dehydrogenase-like iron-containing ADH family enzyme
MVVTVMNSAQRYRELIADLEPHGAALGEPQMVGVGGASSTDQTGLRSHKLEVGFVAEPTGLADREHTLVDLPGTRRCGIVVGRL